ncbi:hypothetical protein RYX36_026121, partial [Vicia faba]
GLGHISAASHQVSMPAMIRAFADWTHQGKKTRKKKHKSVNDCSSVSCVDFQDLCCGPGIDVVAFGDESQRAFIFILM